MNKKGLKVLEYNKIIELLSYQAGSEMAKEKLKALTPSDNAAEIREHRQKPPHSRPRLSRRTPPLLTARPIR